LIPFSQERGKDNFYILYFIYFQILFTNYGRKLNECIPAITNPVKNSDPGMDFLIPGLKIHETKNLILLPNNCKLQKEIQSWRKETQGLEPHLRHL